MTAIQNQNSHNDLSTATYGQTRHRDYDMAILPWGATEPSMIHPPVRSFSSTDDGKPVEKGTQRSTSSVTISDSPPRSGSGHVSLTDLPKRSAASPDTAGTSECMSST